MFILDPSQHGRGSSSSFLKLPDTLGMDSPFLPAEPQPAPLSRTYRGFEPSTWNLHNIASNQRAHLRAKVMAVGKYLRIHWSCSICTAQTVRLLDQWEQLLKYSFEMIPEYIGQHWSGHSKHPKSMTIVFSSVPDSHKICACVKWVESRSGHCDPLASHCASHTTSPDSRGLGVLIICQRTQT